MLSSLSELWRAGEGLYSEENTENETIDLRKKRKSPTLDNLGRDRSEKGRTEQMQKMCNQDYWDKETWGKKKGGERTNYN